MGRSPPPGRLATQQVRPAGGRVAWQPRAVFVLPEPLVWEPAAGSPLPAAPVVTTTAAPTENGVCRWLSAMAARVVRAAADRAPGPVALERVGNDRRPPGLPVPVGVDPAGRAPGAEWYELEVADGGATIRAETAAGLARGAATLVQLLGTSPAGE